MAAGVAAAQTGDFAGARHEWQPLAEAGDAEAQVRLGTLHVAGAGTPQDFAEAAAWFRRAAEQGHAEAQFNLGLLYENGQGVPRSDAEALRWYTQALRGGHDPAFARMADILSRMRFGPLLPAAPAAPAAQVRPQPQPGPVAATIADPPAAAAPPVLEEPPPPVPVPRVDRETLAPAPSVQPVAAP